MLSSSLNTILHLSVVLYLQRGHCGNRPNSCNLQWAEDAFICVALSLQPSSHASAARPSKIKQKHIPLLSLSLCTETSSSPHGARLSQPVTAMLRTTPMPFPWAMALCQSSRTACCAGSWHCNSHMCKQNATSSPPVFVSHHWCLRTDSPPNFTLQLVTARASQQQAVSR